jgi:hypothetical protein
MDMRFVMWNVRSLHGAGSLMTVAKEISKYKSDFVGIHARWERGGTEPAGEYTFLYGKGKEYYELCTSFFLHKRIIPAVKRVTLLVMGCRT